MSLDDELLELHANIVTKYSEGIWGEGGWGTEG